MGFVRSFSVAVLLGAAVPAWAALNDPTTPGTPEAQRSIGTNITPGSVPGLFVSYPGSGTTFRDLIGFSLAGSVTDAVTSTIRIDGASILNFSSLGAALYQETAPSTYTLLQTFSSLTNATPLAAVTLSNPAGATYRWVVEGTTSGLGGGAYAATVSAVPEAGTLAMMLAGLGLVGWVARRRA
jgi:hypothetical protein